MYGSENPIDALTIIRGVAAMGLAMGWAMAIVTRLAFHRPVSVRAWVLHGAGVSGVLGIGLAIAFLALPVR